MSIEVKLPSDEDNFTTTKHRFVTYLLGPPNNPIAAELHPIDAINLYHKDKSEQHYHIEFPDDDNKLKLPRVWWIGPWKTDYNRVVKQKQESAARRLEANKREENAVKMARQLVKMTGIDYAQAYKTCMQCASKKDEHAAEALKTKLDL